jgi:hypothetical protein
MGMAFSETEVIEGILISVVLYLAKLVVIVLVAVKL